MATTLGAASSPTIPSIAPARSTERSVHSCPWLKPSNVTVPIITITNGTVPVIGSSRGRPPSGGRSPTTRSRVSHGERREKRLK